MTKSPVNQWKTLDKDLRRISSLELATQYVARPLVAPGLALAFIVVVAIAAAIFSGGSPDRLMVIAAAVVGAYMALNIGANDVANNMGPAVGANALTMGGALVIAAIFEVSGALIAGGDVVTTISSGIVAPSALADGASFVNAMLAALLASAVWLNFATWVGAPVSTTHSIVGGVLGAGVTAAGFSAVNWDMMGMIVASWVISPLLGGIIAAILLAFIKRNVIYVEDKLAAARVWVPLLVALMAGSFTAYLALKGLRRVVDIGMFESLLIGLGVAVVTWLVAVPVVRKQSRGMENRKKSLKKLFGMPLVVAAALLSFAHGANDVSNAVGPLAAIVHTLQEGPTGSAVGVPLWVMMIGALGISFGLMLFGPKLIRLVGNEITKLNPVRAFCVALSAAIAVIVASALGMPVSSTHIAVGAIFGVGFYREYHSEKRARQLGIIKGRPVAPEERVRRKLVRRSHVLTMSMAWVVTVPATALFAAVLFSGLQFFTN